MFEGDRAELVALLRRAADEVERREAAADPSEGWAAYPTIAKYPVGSPLWGTEPARVIISLAVGNWSRPATVYLRRRIAIATRTTRKITNAIAVSQSIGKAGVKRWRQSGVAASPAAGGSAVTE